MRRFDRSPLDTLEVTFRLLTAGPTPLALDGRTIGLRRDSIGLWDLRAMLYHPATGAAVQRAALVALVERARRRRGAWLVGLAGVLLPGLCRQVTCLPLDRSGGTAGPGGRVLAGLLERLDTPGVPSQAIAESLLWTVVRPPAPAAAHVRPRARLTAVPGGRR